MKNPAAILFTCLLVLSTSGAWANAKPGFIKVVLERNDTVAGGPPAEVLNLLEAQLVKTYPAFTVLLVPENRRHEIQAVARGAGFQATIRDDWDLVQMPAFIVNTRAPRLPDSGVLSGYPGGEGLYVLQFEAPLDAEWTAQIEQAGLRYVSYLPYNAVLVYGTQNAVTRLAAEPHVQWSSLYHPAFRAQPADLHASDQVGRYVVQLVDVPSNQTVIEELLRASRTEGEVTTSAPYTNVGVEVDTEILRRLIRDPRVVAIERDAQWLASGEREAAAATGTSPSDPVYQDGVQPHRGTGDYRSWLALRGIDTGLNAELIAIADTGLSNGLHPAAHPDFQFSSLFGKAYCGTGTSWADARGHGTMVAGFAAGNPIGSPQDPKDFYYFHYGMGLAPGVSLYAQRIFSTGGILCTGTTVANWAQDAITEKNLRGYHSVVQNHSYNDYATTLVNNVCVQTANGAYSTKAQEYDLAVRDTGLPISVSAGNVCQFNISGCSRPCPSMVLPPATAKNVLSVGASETYRPGMAPPCDHSTQTVRQAEDYWASSLKRVAYVSRRGTTDGRIKPDIVAPASMAGSTIRNDVFKPFCKKPNPALGQSQNENGLYSIDTGTSFAAPQAAGAMAIVNAYWNRAALPALSPAALKAVLVGSSISLKGGTDDFTSTAIAARPNATQGFGRLNIDKATLNSPQQGYLDESSWTSFTGAGQTTSRTFTVSNSSQPTIIVLAWSDEPAAAQAPTTLVRDLNLEVRLAGNCTIYVGNKLSSTTEYSLPGGSCGAKQPPDTKNNVEMVVIPPNTATTFTVHVTAATWGGTVPQKFAVFHYNAYP